MNTHTNTVTINDIIRYLNTQPNKLPVNVDKLIDTFDLLDIDGIVTNSGCTKPWYQLMNDLNIKESDHTLDYIDQLMLNGISNNEYQHVSLLANIANAISDTVDKYSNRQSDIYYEHKNPYAYRLVTNEVLMNKLKLN